MITELNNLIAKNNKIIKAIDEGKNINIEKAVKAAMLSNNVMARLLKKIFTKMETSPKGDSGNFMEDFVNNWGKKQ